MGNLFTNYEKTLRACDNSNTITPQGQSVPSGHRVNPNHLPCNECGSTQRKLGAGRQPREASLLCACGKFIKWIGGSELVKLNQGGQN